jgi:RHS repeat-associated protein
VQTRRADAWGDLEVGTADSDYAFTGREWDSETGLYYYRARYYDSKVGRFISADPLGVASGINFFTYARNNPQTRIDPLGLTDSDGSRMLPVQTCPSGGELDEAEGGLCCRNGQYVLCVNENKWPKMSERAQYCLQMHESTHVDQRRRDTSGSQGCGECSGEPCKTLPHLGPRKPRECQAWWITYLCFRNTGERDSDGDYWEKIAEKIVKGYRCWPLRP